MSRLNEIRQRLEKATPGPWTIKHRQNVITSDGRGATTASGLDGDNERNEANASLIANAPADLAYLLERVTALQDDLEEALNCAKAGFIHPDDLRRLWWSATGISG